MRNRNIYYLKCKFLIIQPSNLAKISRINKCSTFKYKFAFLCDRIYVTDKLYQVKKANKLKSCG